jgi:eukaryotic-like serine/threonine-protein kinase
MAAGPPSHWGDFRGRFIDSTVQPGVRYEMKNILGRGGMGTAYFALRHGQGGLTPVVVKVINPSAHGEEGARAALAIQKEAVALGRLNEQVPPTPYVVRLVDTGAFELRQGAVLLTVPWIAVEYVHGGFEGTTLEERVDHSIKASRHAFAPDRAAQAIRCLSTGIDAVHAVGVIHRDLKPANVLCCGFGLEEVLKIADFGIARPQGMVATYGSTSIGTPGYAAPEQAFSDHGPVTRAVDIFALGALTFYLLTGEDLFVADTVIQTVLLSLAPERRSLLQAQHLSPDLRARPLACRAIDQAIARATAGTSAQRTPDAATFAATVLGALEDGPLSVRSSRDLAKSVVELRNPKQAARWLWTMLHPPGSGRVARGAAWSADGRCLVPTNLGLEYWDGALWRRADAMQLPVDAMRFARSIRPGSWLIGGARGLMAVYTAGAAPQMVPPPAPDAEFLAGDGDPWDLMICVTGGPGRGHALTALAAKRWVRRVELPVDAVVNDIARVDDATWLVCGRYRSGAGFAAIYEPLMWRLDVLPAGDAALVACAGQVDRRIGIAVGRGGALVELTATGPVRHTIQNRPDCATVAVDVAGQAWAGTTGRLLTRLGAGPWQVAWHGAWTTPFTSLHADVGLVHAMTVDGAIVEGRSVGTMM